MSSGTGVADDLVEEWLAQVDFALPQRALGGPLGVPPERGTIGDQRVYGGLAALILVDQLDGGAEQPIHLVTEPDVCFARRCCRRPGTA